MEIHGSLALNLKAAVKSSRRLEGHVVHTDTLGFWSDLISEAQRRRAAGDVSQAPEVDAAIAELEVVLGAARVERPSTLKAR